MKMFRFVRAAALAPAIALGIGTQVQAQDPITCEGAETIQPGTLTVAYNGDMPGTGLKDDQLVGIDGEIMGWVAEQIGLDIKPSLMEWAAEIESVKARRVDAMHGMMGWTEARTEVIAISDPIYYAGPLMTQKKGAGFTSIEQLKDANVGTVQGFGWVPELQSVNPDLKLYETSDAALRDLQTGRVDVLFLDPPLIQYAATQQPELDIESIPVSDPYDPELPSITGKYQVVLGLSKEAPKLQECINQAIARLWETCTNYQMASKYGFDDKYWFDVPGENPRLGVDRPEGWAFPKLGNCG